MSCSRKVAEYQSGAPLASDHSPPFSSYHPRFHLVVSEGVYKIRDLLTMFAPTRTCAGLSHICIWSPINALYPCEGGRGAFRRRRPSASKILRRYFIPENFYEPIYHTSTESRWGWRYAWGPDRRERVGPQYRANYLGLHMHVEIASLTTRNLISRV